MEVSGIYEVDDESESNVSVTFSSHHVDEDATAIRAKAYLDLLKNTQVNPWDNSLKLRENIDQLFERTLHIPKPDVQLPYLKALTVLPTPLINYAPRVDLFGPEGSGKSQVLHILCAVRHSGGPDSIYLNAGSTAVAVRNFINDRRGEVKSLSERNFIMGIDNIESIDKKSLWYLLMLCGYKRGSADIEVSSNTVGQNLKFNCFAPMVWTTVFKLANHPEFRELRRRQDTIIFEKMTDVNREMLDVSIADLSEFRIQINDLWYWDSPEGLTNSQLFVELLKKIKRPKMVGERWQIINSLVVTLIICGWFDEKTAIEWAMEFHNQQLTIVRSGQISLVINQVISSYCANEMALRAKGEKIVLQVPTKMIKERVKTAADNGEITLHRSVNQEVQAYMENEGWVTILKNGSGYWVKE